MTLPKTIYVSQPDGSVNFLEAHERLTDFEDLRDVQVGVYELVDVKRVTISKRMEREK